MKIHFLKIYFALTFLTTYTVFGQSPEKLKLPEPKRLIDKVEAFGGMALNFPNDHGWAEYVFKASDGRTIENANSEMGYFAGIGLVHSMNKRIELKVEFLFEKRLYSTSIDYLDLNGSTTSETERDQRNRYLGISLIPIYFMSDLKRLHFFVGCSYKYLTGSTAYAIYSSAGQPAGGALVNTIDGFEKHVVDALAGGGYLFPVSDEFSGCIRIQGNYGLSYTLNQNNQSLSINSVSLSLAIRYVR